MPFSCVLLVSGSFGAAGICLKRAYTAYRRMQERVDTMQATFIAVETQCEELFTQIQLLEEIVERLRQENEEQGDWYGEAFFNELWNSRYKLRFLLHPHSYLDTYTTSGMQQAVEQDLTPTQVYFLCYKPATGDQPGQLFMRPAQLGGFG